MPVGGALVVVLFLANHKTLECRGVRGEQSQEEINSDGSCASKTVLNGYIVDNYAQDGFSYRFHSDLGNISCKFADTETISKYT